MNYDAIVDKYAAQYDVPGLVIRAVIMSESTRGTWPPTAAAERAFRDEPGVGDASRGLMQLLYGTAKGLGFQGKPDELFDPDTSILWGTRYLKDIIRRYGVSDVRRVYSAYNSGRPDLWQSSTEVKKNVERFLGNLETITKQFVSANPALAVGAGGSIAAAIVFLILWQWKGKGF